jgi:hypothetical protein
MWTSIQVFCTLVTMVSASSFVRASFAATLTVASILLGPKAWSQGTTVLPTDTLPLPTRHKGPSYVELNAHEVKFLQKLPAKFYLNAINESTFRLETNPFQNPPKSSLSFLLNNAQAASNTSTVQSIEQELSQVNLSQQVFREAPNITAGWQFTPRLSVYSNYFAIRDDLLQSSLLNSTTQSVGGGAQYDMPLGKGFDLQPNFQFREFYQTGQPDVFDYLPAITLTKAVGQHTQVYANSLLQLRGLQPFVAPNREIDPFYTVGFQRTQGLWQFSGSSTFFQNFRKPFGRNAFAPVNGYGIVCDFEVARQLFKRIQGLQTFVRAEPVWNFHSDATPSLSGFDFRLFYGIRATLSKPALTGQMQQIRQRLLQPTGN